MSGDYVSDVPACQPSQGSPRFLRRFEDVASIDWWGCARIAWRRTRDVDFLIDADDADRLHDILLGLGYRCVHRSPDAANYLRGEDGFDVLYAHRPIKK